MKSIPRIISLTLCILLLSGCKLLLTGCKTEAQECEQEKKIIVGHCYSTYEYLRTNANGYAQSGSITCFFNTLEVYYGSYRPTFNNHLLRFSLSDSTKRFYSIAFDLFTEVVDPDVFFIKGTWKIDTMEISNSGINIPHSSYTSNHFGDVSTVFSWEYVVYEKKLLVGSLDEYTEGKCLIHGKGVLEIKDTIFTDFPEIYYPPQKIVFEF